MEKSIHVNCRLALACFLTLALYGCGGGSTAPVTPPQTPTEAEQSDIAITASTAGVSPFIASVALSGKSTSELTSVTYTIAPKPAATASAVKVTWALTALSNHGYVKSTVINLPVAGLYQGYDNSVSYALTFSDGSTQTLTNSITTATFIDSTKVYLNPRIIKARAAGSTLGFSFFILKSLLTSPVIVDTDAEVRWVVPGVTPVQSVYFADGQFVLGSLTGATTTLLQLNGTQTNLPVNLTFANGSLDSYTHNIDPGPNGQLAEFNGVDSVGNSVDDIVAEISPLTTDPPDQVYSMAEIIGNYMTKNGDDASAFVRPGVDWFHLNAATYDPSDKSVIISGREDFLVKVDYATHDILWIFGDPTKYWYTFPSLRAKALILPAGQLYPIGQHGVSITSDGKLMLFNDGYWSLNQPTGEPKGVSRTYSAVTAYTINASALTANVAWNFDYGQTVLSQICGSAYEAGNSYLVDYATATNWTEARLVGLDSGKNVVFDFDYQSPGFCGAAWNAIPVEFENLQITK